MAPLDFTFPETVEVGNTIVADGESEKSHSQVPPY